MRSSPLVTPATCAGRAPSCVTRCGPWVDLAAPSRRPRNLILYFGPSVRDAECMAFLLRERQIPAAVVSGNTREATRRRTIDRFKRAEIRVLCNCEVLTTGFDAPMVSHVGNAPVRPELGYRRFRRIWKEQTRV